MIFYLSSLCAFLVGMILLLFLALKEHSRLVEKLSTAEDELEAARASQQYWFHEYRNLAYSVQFHRADGESWKYGSYDS